MQTGSFLEKQVKIDVTVGRLFTRSRESSRITQAGNCLLYIYWDGAFLACAFGQRVIWIRADTQLDTCPFGQDLRTCIYPTIRRLSKRFLKQKCQEKRWLSRLPLFQGVWIGYCFREVVEVHAGVLWVTVCYSKTGTHIFLTVQCQEMEDLDFF